MTLDFHRARPCLQAGNLTKLFVEELGWEPARQKLTLRAGEIDYAFTAVAEKRGFGRPNVQLFGAAPSGVQLLGQGGSRAQNQANPANTFHTAFGGNAF